MKNKNIKLFLFLIPLLAGFFGFGKLAIASGKIIINEIMYSPEGIDAKHEWLEIFNSSDETMDLSDWILFEANTKHGLTAYQGNLDLKPREYAIIADDAGTFKSDHSSYTGTIIDSAFSLSNSGESFSIKNNLGEVASETSYTNDLGADGNGFSLERTGIGSLRESYVPGGTPGEKNSEKPDPKIYSNKLRINEIFPAPKEKNSGKEFVEIINVSDENIDLSDLRIEDEKNHKVYFPEKTLAPKEIFYLEGNFELNSTTADSAFLIGKGDTKDNPIDFVRYDHPKYDLAYAFDGSKWRWTNRFTKGEKNQFNNLPEVSKKKDNKIYANVYADFSAKGRDADKDKLKFTWDFGDGHKSYKKETRHKFKKAGKYKVTLKVSDGSEDKIENFNIKVEKFPQSKVKIVNVSANPAGKDSETEFITLQNKSKKKINLKDWSVATGSKNLYNHPIAEDVFIKPGEILKLNRDYSKFALNNKKAKIELRYPDGKVASKLSYDKKKESIKEDEIYTKESGQWAWVAPKTEIKLASATKPIEVSPRVAEEESEALIILAVSDQNFSEDENLRKNVLKNFTKPPGIVLGVATFKPASSGAYPIQNKNYYLETIFTNLNSIFNYFINKVFLKLAP